MNEEERVQAQKRMLQMIEDMHVCNQIADRTWKLMSFPASYTKLPCDGYCFRILLPANEKVKAVSCSIPPDANRGIADRMRNSFDPIDITYETALFGYDDDFIHIDALGYEDIKRFDCYIEVTEEVMRVAEKIQEIDAKQK
jgi:hypothetical protein